MRIATIRGHVTSTVEAPAAFAGSACSSPCRRARRRAADRHRHPRRRHRPARHDFERRQRGAQNGRRRIEPRPLDRLRHHRSGRERSPYENGHRHRPRHVECAVAALRRRAPAADASVESRDFCRRGKVRSGHRRLRSNSAPMSASRSPSAKAAKPHALSQSQPPWTPTAPLLIDEFTYKPEL